MADVTGQGSFSKQSNLVDWLKKENESTIKLIKNPHTDIIFFVTGSGEQGRVSKKIQATGKILRDHYVSWFTPTDGSDESWMLHTSSHENEVDSFSLNL